MGNVGNFYSWGRYNSNVGITSLAKKVVYEDEVSITDNGDGTYTLMIEDTEIGTIDTNSSIVTTSYDEDTHILKITTFSGSEETSTEIDLSSLVDTYCAGNGLTLSDNTFTVIIDGDSDSYLTVSSDGILLTGVKDAIDAESEEREKADNAINESVTELETWVDTYSLSEDEIDEIILSVDESTNYGMAEAMGVENN